MELLKNDQIVSLLDAHRKVYFIPLIEGKVNLSDDTYIGKGFVKLAMFDGFPVFKLRYKVNSNRWHFNDNAYEYSDPMGFIAVELPSDILEYNYKDVMDALKERGIEDGIQIVNC